VNLQVRDTGKVPKHLASIFKDFSRHLEQGNLPEQEEFRSLRGERCVWTGRGFVLPDSAVLTGAEGLAPALYRVEQGLAQKHKTVLLLLGVSFSTSLGSGMSIIGGVLWRVDRIVGSCVGLCLGGYG